MKIISLCLLLIPFFAFSTTPDCDSPESWAPSKAYVFLTNNNVINKDEVIHNKTIVTRIASESIGNNIYRQVHIVSFQLKSGKVVEVITSNEASTEECSLGGVDVFVISAKFSDDLA